MTDPAANSRASCDGADPSAKLTRPSDPAKLDAPAGETKLNRASGDTNKFAVLTSPGPAAIAAIQICGPKVPEFAAAFLHPTRGKVLKLKPGALVLAYLHETPGEALPHMGDAPGAPLDFVLVAVSPTTAEWQARLFLHGSPWLVQRCCALLTAAGFSRQQAPCAPLWPAQDLIEMEAHALLPQMLTFDGACWLLRQAKQLPKAIDALQAGERHARQQCREIAERLRIFDWYSRPARVALVGPPNAGKSTLANALAQQEVSLTSPQPGTTRDWVEVPAVVRGFPVLWIDTAGLRPCAEGLEAAAVAKTQECVRTADAVILVLDGAAGGIPDRFPDLPAMGLRGAETAPAMIALNKADSPAFDGGLRDLLPSEWRDRVTVVSAAQGTNLTQLGDALLVHLERWPAELLAPGAFTKRQAEWLEHAADAREFVFYQTMLKRCVGDVAAWAELAINVNRPI